MRDVGERSEDLKALVSVGIGPHDDNPASGFVATSTGSPPARGRITFQGFYTAMLSVIEVSWVIL